MGIEKIKVTDGDQTSAAKSSENSYGALVSRSTQEKLQNNHEKQQSNNDNPINEELLKSLISKKSEIGLIKLIESSSTNINKPNEEYISQFLSSEGVEPLG